MAKQIIPTYTFDKTAKTVTLTDFTTVNLERLLLIVNTTDNIIIYNFADSTIGAAAATNVFTLEYDTSGMDNADNLMIIYDIEDGNPIYDYTPVAQRATAILHKTDDISASGDILVVSASQQALIHRFEIVPDPDSTNHTKAILRTGTTEHAGWWLNKNGAGYITSPHTSKRYFEGAADDNVNVTLSNSISCRYNLWYELVNV